MTTPTFDLDVFLSDTPSFFTGSSSSSSLVPRFYDVAIDGRPYMIDTANQEWQGPRSLPLTRSQSDASDSPGEQTINREDLWRRSTWSWLGGAGQAWYDGTTSTSDRFYKSRGVDPWTEHSLSLLPDTTQVLSSANTGLQLIVGGSYVYVADGTTTRYSSNGTSWTANTGATGTVTGLCSDGQYVYVADGSGVRRATLGTTALGAVWNTLVAGRLAYVKDRIMATGVGANQHLLYNITSSAAPAALFTPNNTAFTWVGFAEGATAIYAAGYAGDKSLIYRIPIKSDGTGLDVPIVAGELPSGEVVSSITSYLGYLVIGTTKGFRLASVATSLIMGPLVATGTCYCGEGQSRFVWFGWTNYSASPTYTGLGRLDLSKFTGPLVPAYATDLMAATSGTVAGVVTFGSKHYFSVDGSGIWSEATTKVATGEIESGHVTFGIADQKVLDRISIASEPLAGQIDIYTASESGVYHLSYSSTAAGSVANDALQLQLAGKRHDVKLVLTRSATDTTTGPQVTSSTIFALPTPRRSETWTLPLVLAEQIEPRGMPPQPMDVDAELDAFRRLVSSATPLVVVQIGDLIRRAFVDDYAFLPTHHTETGKTFNGTLVVRLKVPATQEA